MPRTTRAAAKAQAEHVEPLGLTVTADGKRDPLRSITPNSIEGSPEAERPIEEEAAKKRKPKAKGRKKKPKKDAADDEAPKANDDPAVDDNDNEDEPDTAEPAGEENAHLVSRDQDAAKDRDILVERPASPTVKKQHLANNSSEKLSTMETGAEEHPLHGAAEMEPAAHAHLNGHVNGDVAQENHVNSGPGTPEKLSTDQKTPSEPTSLITSPTLAGPQPEDPIEALDFLEDAIEEVGKILPNLDKVAPEKPAKKENVSKGAPKPTTSGKTRGAAAKATQGTRTGLSLMKTTQPTATATRSRAVPSSALTSSTPKPTTSMTSKRHSTIAPAKSAKESNTGAGASAATPAPKTTKPPTDYLASKRRPISLQIPPPPERVRSAKPPTRPTFTLPGDSLTAKRKAAAEERKRKEEEELARKREFKARPVPGAVAKGARPASMMVRQTASSRARMSVCGVEGAEALAALGASTATPAAAPGLRRAGTVTGATSTSSSAAAAAARAAAKAKRSSVVAAAAAAAAAPKRPTGQAGTSAPPRASIIVPKRGAPAGSPAANSPRAATGPGASRAGSVALSVASSAAGSAITPEDAAAQRVKARAIYNRDRAEGEVRERSRRDKEEAARRARAEAAEKGRIASREWAEKNKRRVASAAAAAKGGMKQEGPMAVQVVPAVE